MVERFHPLVIGLGNEYRHDDAAGMIVARRLRKLVPNEINIIEQSGEGAVLMETWKEAKRAIIIDAVHSGAAPGTIFRFEAHAQPLPTKFFHYSTHAFSIAEAIELARALKQLPPSLVVYGIEGKNFAAGVGLSAEAEKAAQEVAERIRQEI
jgi:hydrogenase maturation protease